MELCLEYGYTSLNKYGEELCGDKVECAVNNNYTTLVLADGLGSGVKANILSTLTSKILCTMVANDIEMSDCLETIIQSLPVCKVRGVAYSTFSVIHVNNEGEGYLFEFDNPQAIYYHKGKCMNFVRKELEICGKKVFQSELKLVDGDIVMVMSDGTIHAGIGMTLNFGWQRPEIMEHLDRTIKPYMSARCVACVLAAACNDLYLDKPGDDTTVAAVRIRKILNVNIMVGPPVDKNQDNFYVAKFMDGDAKRVVCGGTSSQIVARYLNKPLRTSFDFPDKDVPPIGFIDGIDLTTEGVLTLRRLLELSEKYISVSDLTPKTFTKTDGASMLANVLFEEATHVQFFVGRSVNVAHQGLPIDTSMKMKLVERLAANLKIMGKQVTVNYN
ncbi:MAG: SpoIIE family protein phosphatase [Bacteroidales bacterium]|nr:SpoIIE family protein phosphatase [Bacteroidales bacterium]MDD4669609.1 SpoIIE family protein phosphatase [Bacteroidales bacterium]